MKFNAEQFLKDIGLDLDVALLHKPTEPPVEKSNLLTFYSLTSQRMDCPRTAAYVHMKNLIATYGEDIVKEALEVVVNTNG